MRKLLFVFMLGCLVGCSQPTTHVCRQSQDPFTYEITYVTDQSGEVQTMKQTIKVMVKNQEEANTYGNLLDDTFENYLANYQEACTITKLDQDEQIGRCLEIDFSKLSAAQKETMSFESEEKLLIAQLEYAGYTCK